MVADWIIMALISIAINVVAYLIMPKPKMQKPEPAQELDTPNSEEGRPITAIFGTLLIKELQVLSYFDKSKSEREVNI